jgi:hypothetical protein
MAVKLQSPWVLSSVRDLMAEHSPTGLNRSNSWPRDSYLHWKHCIHVSHVSLNFSVLFDRKEVITYAYQSEVRAYQLAKIWKGVFRTGRSLVRIQNFQWMCKGKHTVHITWFGGNIFISYEKYGSLNRRSVMGACQRTSEWPYVKRILIEILIATKSMLIITCTRNIYKTNICKIKGVESSKLFTFLFEMGY